MVKASRPRAKPHGVPSRPPSGPLRRSATKKYDFDLQRALPPASVTKDTSDDVEPATPPNDTAATHGDPTDSQSFSSPNICSPAEHILSCDTRRPSRELCHTFPCTRPNRDPQRPCLCHIFTSPESLIMKNSVATVTCMKKSLIRRMGPQRRRKHKYTSYGLAS